MAHPAFQRIDHRPWPCPDRGWAWSQTWEDLLFAHWRVPAEQLRPLIPAPLELETFDGDCWLGIVPFHMAARRRFMPFGNHFRELNVRTYVTYDGKPGVWFFSLDATDALAVWVARRFFGLPYFGADIRMSKHDGRYRFESSRRGGNARLQVEYGPMGAVAEAEPGSHGHWLTERYCLYATNRRGKLVRADVQHQPWPLQPAHAHFQVNTMTAPLHLDLRDEMPTLHFAQKVRVVVWSPEELD